MNSTFLKTSILLLPVILFLSCEKVDLSNDSILIKNAQIIDIETGEIIPDKSIIIENKNITKIFKSGSIAYKATTEFDAKNGYVIPGLWDLHIHLRGGEKLIDQNKRLLPLYLAYGVTTVRDAGGDLTPQILQWRAEAIRGELAAPYIYTSGPKLDGPNSTWEGSLELSSAKDVSAALDSLEALGVDYVKIYDSRLTRDLYLEILRQTEERNMIVTGHMPMTVMLDEAIDAGLDGIDHLYYVLKGASSKEAKITEKVRRGELGFWGAVRELAESYDPDKARRLYQKLAQNKVAVVPTLYIDEVLSFLHQVDHSNDEMLAYIPNGIQETYARRVNAAMQRNDDTKQFEEELHQLFKNMIVPMQQAGVQILAGSDNGAYNSYVYAGESLHQELRILSESGLTPLEALQTSMLNGSIFFGVEDHIGKIAEGFKGDLVVLSRNPLADIENTRAIQFVVSNGQSYDKAEIELMLNQLSTQTESDLD